jgi:hypothetical protein
MRAMGDTAMTSRRTQKRHSTEQRLTYRSTFVSTRIRGRDLVPNGANLPAWPRLAHRAAVSERVVNGQNPRGAAQRSRGAATSKFLNESEFTDVGTVIDGPYGPHACSPEPAWKR